MLEIGVLEPGSVELNGIRRTRPQHGPLEPLIDPLPLQGRVCAGSRPPVGGNTVPYNESRLDEVWSPVVEPGQGRTAVKPARRLNRPAGVTRGLKYTRDLDLNRGLE